MKTKVQHGPDDARVDGRVKLTIETAEDCQIAQDRLDALKSGAQGYAEERRTLEAALSTWHRMHAL